MDERKKNHILACQCIRITLFVYVYVRACDAETAFLDSFLNPLFFFLDGAVFQILEKESFLKFTYRKFRQFIVPYYFLAALLLLSEIGFSYAEGWELTSKWAFDRIVCDILPEFRTYSLWYLPALFCGEMIVYAIVKLSKDNLGIGTLLAFVILAVSLIYNKFCHKYLPWSLDAAFIGSFYMYFGYLTTHKKLDKIYNAVYSNRWLSLVYGLIMMVFVLFGSLAIYRYFNGQHFSGTKALYEPYYLVIPFSFVGVYAIMFLAHALENKIFINIGKMTMIILAIEQEVGIKLYRYFIAKNWYLVLGDNIAFDPQQMLCAILGTLLIVAISVPIYYLFMYTPICVIFNKKYISKHKKNMVVS